MLIKYSQIYNFPVFHFVSLEAGTAAFKLFCVMIPSLVDTSLDFGLFRVVRHCRPMPMYIALYTRLFRPSSSGIALYSGLLCIVTLLYTKLYHNIVQKNLFHPVTLYTKLCHNFVQNNFLYPITL